MRAIIWAILLALLPTAAGAQDAREAEIRAIQGQLSLIQQQQQSLHQQFQMIQELQRQAQQQNDRTLINYDDAVRNRQEREGRVSQYASDLHESYARFRALEDQKLPLMQRMNQLMQPR
jgi:hypothetical protein